MNYFDGNKNKKIVVKNYLLFVVQKTTTKWLNINSHRLQPVVGVKNKQNPERVQYRNNFDYCS